MPLRNLYSRTSAGTAHTNSTDEAVLDSYQLPAFSLGAGKRLRWTGSVRATATNGTDTLRTYLRVGTVALTGTAVWDATAVDVADNDIVTWDLELVPRSAPGSSSGTIEVFGSASIEGASGTVTRRAVRAQLTTVDFGAALYLAVTADWSAASASDSAQCEAMNVDEIS